MLGAGGVVEQVQQTVEPVAVSWWSAIWSYVSQNLELLPPWARVGLVLFLVVSVIVCRLWLPALANFYRSKRRDRDG